MFHIPVVGLYVPVLVLADWKVNPVGSMSFICTFVALSGSCLFACMVIMAYWMLLSVYVVYDCVTPMSAAFGTISEHVAWLLALFVSCWSTFVSVAVFVRSGCLFRIQELW